MDLLLLTKVFPYGTDEAFIENEINIISDFYDHVVLIACEVPEREKLVRKVPKNVEVHRITSVKKSYDLVHGVFYRNKNDEVYYNELNTIGLKQKIFLSYFESKCQRIYKKIIENNYIANLNSDFILYSYWLFTTARVGDLISGYCSPKFKFSRAHRYDLYEEKNGLCYLPYRKHLLRQYNYVFPCSQSGENYLATKYPDFRKKIHTSLLGTKDHGVAEYSKDDVFRIISCSRLFEVKRVDYIIKIMEKVEASGKRILWTHIGDGKLRNSLEKEAHSRLSPSSYKFVGNKTNKEVMEFYRTNPVDLFLNVSSSEGLPVSIMESMSFGIPVIATDVGGTSEIVLDGITGYLINENFNIENVASLICKFIDERNSVSNMSLRKNCRQFWEEHFQADKNYRELHCKISKM